MLRNKFFVVFSSFLSDSSLFSILQFLGNFLHSILCEDGPSFPICYTNVFSHVELDLPIDSSRCDSVNAYSDFFVPNSDAYDSLLSCSLKMFSEISSIRMEFSDTLKNRIFCDSSDSHKYRSVNLSLTSTMQH